MAQSIALRFPSFVKGWRKSELKRQLVWLTLPIFIETLLVMSLGAVDTFMLSRTGDGNVAAVGVANQVMSFLFIIFAVINLGTSVLCSQYIGAGLRQQMRTVVGVALVVNLVFGIAVSALLWFAAEPMLVWMGLESQFVPQGAGYMRTVGVAAFVQAIALTLSAVLRSADKAYWPMIVVLVVNLLNIAGNYMFIFGAWGAPELGVQGAALTTAGCRTIAMFALFIIVFSTTVDGFPWHVLRRWPTGEFRKLMKIGVPAAGEQMSYECSQLTVTFFIALLGTAALAARTYCFNIIIYSYIFSIAISHGAAIVVGHLTGRGKDNAAEILGWYVRRVATLCTVGFALVLAILGPTIMSNLTTDPEVIALGVAVLWVDVVLEIGRPINILFVNTLQATGDVYFPFWIGVAFMWTVGVGLAWVAGIALGFGLVGMWWMFCADEWIRAVIFTRRWRSGRWRGRAFVGS